MLDSKKRQTLKFMGAAPLVSLPFVASAGELFASETQVPKLPAASPRTGMQLEIQIIDSTAVPDNTVVFRNRSDDVLVITRFMPGHIVYDGKLMDLNAAMGDRQIELSPGQSRAFEYDVWSVLNTGPVEYVWADHAIDALSEETSVVTLGAFMADTNAVVYANTRQYIPS